jgi:hypothetical protein
MLGLDEILVNAIMQTVKKEIGAKTTSAWSSSCKTTACG